MNQFTETVKSELNELESRDADQLFGCIRDNCQEMGLEMSEEMDDELFEAIETALAKARGEK